MPYKIINRLFYTCTIIPCILFSLSAAYAGEPINISADHLEYFSETDSYIAKGSVRILYENIFLSADEIHLNAETYNAVASGNVRQTEPEPEDKAGQYRQKLYLLQET
jgi:lipopolysaccharide assembly outer membrane protein LptD (OstA)